MGEKDIIEKTLESYNDVFADIVNVLLFNGKRRINENDLISETTNSIYKADSKVHVQDRDVAKYWKNGLIRLALFGIENQSAVDYDMPLRAMCYDSAAYRAQLANDEKRTKAGLSKERYPVVTLVLYFGYKNHWRKPLNLLECINTPDELKPYVNDYRINLFEIAWLSDETVAKFQSDFKIVADYFVQMRKNRDYKPSPDTIRHVQEVLQLMSVMTDDNRFEEACNEIMERGKNNMCEFLDTIENRGIEKGIEKARFKAVTNTLSRYARRQLPINSQVLDDIAEDNEITIEKVRSIAKENGIALSC
ncbi:MAG: Rpn family recombination-promoting nuclease/putative transposase [Selenomonadaceae bacterium]|nr:Rpn family recombination-promoting nuclease/putative transposase [Selenomonadaceae bacterium]